MDMQTTLSAPTRRAIIELLATQGRLSATEICRHFQLTPSAISQHLQILRQSNIVSVEKRSQQRLYEINEAARQNLAAWAIAKSKQYERFNSVLLKESDRAA